PVHQALCALFGSQRQLHFKGVGSAAFGLDEKFLALERLLSGGVASQKQKKRQEGAFEHESDSHLHQWALLMGLGVSGWISAAISPLSPGPKRTRTTWPGRSSVKPK